MSRRTIFQDDRLTLIGGQDHAIGQFLQLFDREMEKETPDGEGIIFEWSQAFGVETNLTGLPSVLPPPEIIDKYIKEHSIYKNKKIT